MKKIIIFIVLMFGYSANAQSIVIPDGATIFVPAGTDICAGEYGNILGNIFGSKNNEALAHLVNTNAFLVDVRTPMEFGAGHVSGPINIPLDQVKSKLVKFKDKENIVVFCRSGNRSGQAKVILEQNGFSNVTNGGTWRTVDALINK